MKLEDNKKHIYVKGERFDHLKYLLLIIKTDEISYLDDIESINEAIESLDNSLLYYH